MSGVPRSTIHDLESGESTSLQNYLQLARALRLRPEFSFVDSRRCDPLNRQRDAVHAAMSEAQAAHLRRAGCEVRLDEPYQHYQFAGRGDLVAWQIAERRLLHIENRTEFPDLQDSFGRFNAKRAYLGQELASRAGVERWRSETHVIAALWSSDSLRIIRRHRASFESVCPSPPDSFASWWSGESPVSVGHHSTLVLFDPVTGECPAGRAWVGLGELEKLRSRYRDYADAADRLRGSAPSRVRPGPPRRPCPA